MSRRGKKDDYRVAIITALSIELAAVRAMLDEKHESPVDFKQHIQDPNSYTWGKMSGHNVILTSLPAGVYGSTSATTTIMPLKYAFPRIKWGLMVGIAAGIPREGRDIRFGDVVVSQPGSNTGGVFQYDLGKALHTNNWQRLDWLARPSEILLRALANMQSEHELYGFAQAQQHLHEALDRHHHWAKAYNVPQGVVDQFFLASYSHPTINKNCQFCDPDMVVQRQKRDTTDFQIHYGVIESGNTLVKDSNYRDSIVNMVDQCICLEMEAAGLMNDFPCLVIRGICDYADSHKNDKWQRYASATAAALAKEFLTFMSTADAPSQLHHSRRSTHSVSGSKVEAMHADVIEVDLMSVAGMSTQDMSDELCGQEKDSSQVTLSPNLSQEENHKGLRTPTAELAAPDSMRIKNAIPDMGFVDRYDSAHIESKDAADVSIPNMWVDAKYALPVEPSVPAQIDGQQARPIDVNKVEGDKLQRYLVEASAAGNPDLVRTWINQGASVDSIHNGLTPLIAAVIGGPSGFTDCHMEIVKLLLEKKANIQGKGEGGGTVLHRAVKSGNSKLVSLLLSRNADVDAVNEQKQTPLHIAALQGNFPIVKRLLSKGADRYAEDIKKRRPSVYARSRGHHQMERFLNGGIILTRDLRQGKGRIC